jgi:hypothetical protein
MRRRSTTNGSTNTTPPPVTALEINELLSFVRMAQRQGYAPATPPPPAAEKIPATWPLDGTEVIALLGAYLDKLDTYDLVRVRDFVELEVMGRAPVLPASLARAGDAGRL